MCAELEGSWRESWSKDSVASKLKQVLRLMKSRPVPWVLVEVRPVCSKDYAFHVIHDIQLNTTSFFRLRRDR
jgi:hypothetical protein